MEVEIPPPHEEYRYLHSKLRLKLTWKDLLKLAMGAIPLMSFCVRILVVKDKDGKIKEIDTDMTSARVLIVKAGDEVPTKDPVFNKDELHNQEG